MFLFLCVYLLCISIRILKELKENLERAVHSSKDHYFKTVLQNFVSEDLKKFQKCISEKKPVSQLSIYCSIVTDLDEIACHLNEYFQSVLTKSGICLASGTTFYPSDASFISYAGVVSMLFN